MAVRRNVRGEGGALVLVTAGVGTTVKLSHEVIYDRYGDYDPCTVYRATFLSPEGRYETVSYNPAAEGEGAEVDATPEMVAAYEARIIAENEARKREAERMETERRAAEEVRRAKAPARGKRVRVVRGRKVPIGTEGEVFWIGMGRYGERVGIRVAGQTEPVWTASSNVEVIGAEKLADPVTADTIRADLERAVRAAFPDRAEAIMARVSVR